MDKEIYDYIISEQTNYKTVRVPITDSVDWNMPEYIERCTNVANGWYHSGKNDGLRPYQDIVTPIINVARRSEGFDVKDIVPFVNDADDYYKSFLIAKYHPQWARKNELDTFIDEVVESSIIYDLVVVKNVNNVRPEVIKLQQIAFCDQTDFLSSPFALRHQYTPAQLVEFKGKWNADKIDEAIVMAEAEKNVVTPNNQQKVKTTGKYIEVFELHGNLPESWLVDGGDKYKYTPQLHIVCFYTSSDGKKNGITLYKGKSKPITDLFKTLVISPVFGRACGRSIVETLFEPQVWVNYSAIKIKAMLDSALSVILTDSDEVLNQKLDNVKPNQILKHNKGDNTTKLTSDLSNIQQFTNYQVGLENNARVLGSASDAQLGTNPVSGTPFALQNLVVQQGQGIHEWRQGKIATFFADVLYRDWILGYLVDEMNKGLKFSEELTLDEMQELSTIITENLVEDKIKEKLLQGIVVTEQEREVIRTLWKDDWLKKGNRRFMEVLEGELDEIPVEVFVNIKGKQRDMVKNADTITNIIREVIRNPQAFTQIPGIAKAFNQLLEESGMSPINFSQVITARVEEPAQITPPVEEGEITNNKK